jgi:hypothetical protein
MAGFTQSDIIDMHIDNLLEKNKDSLQRESILKIAPDVHTYQNSINILVGKQGAGKTFTALREIIKINYADPNLHLVIIINKDGSPNDKTYDILKPMFQVPVIFLSYDDATTIIETMLDYKELYNTIKEQHLEHRIDPTQVDEINEVLFIRDFSRPFLNTVLYFEDCVNNKLFARPTLYFPQLVAKSRHHGLIWFFAVQFWKGLTTELKANATTIYVFRSYSNQQINYILQQTPLRYELPKVYKVYKQLHNHDKMIVDTIAGTITLDKT